MPSYSPADVERRWQSYWLRHKTFRTPDPGDPLVKGKPKAYLLDMFPYPSGAGLHVGHPEGYTATDILSRFRRMQGYHVLHPMGWDAFGLPAEQHAIATGEHPRVNTKRNVDNFRRQIQELGFSYDWDREVDTTDPAYFRWTQWIFLLLHDTWYDPAAKKGRPIAELPIPPEVAAKGDAATRAYVDGHRLAYQAEVPVNWCPALGTVLANEEVIDGKSERGDHPVVRMPLRQWLMRITAYADRLHDDLAPLDWSESIKEMQRNWIGRSVGAEVQFAVSGRPDDAITVFTTRPDTLFGATYMVLAPEHPLVERITTSQRREEVEAYRAAAARKSERDRTQDDKKKTGVFTGAFAVNPVNDEHVPVWIADYVLAGYGTGAIMAVPAHDERDFAFATQFNLPVRVVVQPPPGWMEATGSTIDLMIGAYTDTGVAVASGLLDGLDTAAAKRVITEWLEERGVGRRRINYKLRDWLFSRQRYWGEPFPLLHELGADGEPNGVIVPLDASELPLTLPEVKDYKPTGSPEGPLALATEWVNVERNGKKYRRETNTMPQWAGSCWYFLRYVDPKNDTAFADFEKLKYWLPVDTYIGGAEHAVLHLLYSRFWHKVLFDRGYVPTAEPFQKLVNQGMILGEMEYHVTLAAHDDAGATFAERGIQAARRKAADGKEDTYVLKVAGADGAPADLPDELIEKRKGKTYLAGTTVELTGRAEKMSKSRGNVVNPDDIVREYGADSLRLYEMFMGPLEATKPWSTKSVEGVYRFLSRTWRLMVDDHAEGLKLSAAVTDEAPDRETLRQLHRTIQKATDETAALKFNTAIAAMMEYTNFLTKRETRPRAALEPFVLLLAPYAPHVAEELWRALGHPETLAYEPWPAADPAYTKDDEIEVPVQVNGKVKAKLTVPADVADADLQAAALADPKVREALAGKAVKLVKVVPRRLVNVVAG